MAIRQDSCRVQRPGAVGAHGIRPGDIQQRRQRAPPFGQVFAGLPEPKERATEAQPPLGIARLHKVFDCGAEIIVLRIAPAQPGLPLSRRHLSRSLFCQYQAISRMSPPGAFHLAALLQPFSTVFADGLEHAEARLCISGTHLAQQALVHQRRDAVEHIDP